MDAIGLKSGKLTFIEEIVSSRDQTSLAKHSVNVTGRLIAHEVEICIATISDPVSKKELHVDTCLIEPFDARFGSLFQFIGELEIRKDVEGCNLVLKARVVRCVDGLDVSMYRKSIECQRQYLATRTT